MLLSQAQKYDIPLNYNLNQEFIINKGENDSLFHLSVRPYNQWFTSEKTFNNTFKDTGDYYYDFTVLLFQKHLLEIHKKDVHIGMDVLANVYFGNRYYKTNSGYSHRISTNSRGFRIVGNIGTNVSFETRFYENQFFYPHFIDSIVDSRRVAPGVGRTKSFKQIGFDVGNSSGTVSVKLHENFNIKFGRDKIFIGSGYRSLLISDNASNYPLLILNAKSSNNKIQYQTTYAWMQSLSRSITVVSTESLFKRKNATFHYLSFKPNTRLEIGVFESTIFNVYNDSTGFTSPHILFYNPILGINTLVNGLQGENNSLLGLNLSYLAKHYQLYGQLAIDDKNKFAFQTGVKWFEPFNLKKNWVQLEFNKVPSYMYSQSGQFILQNYTHMNQELAHPLGASFSEVLFMYHFYWDRFFTNIETVYAHRKRGNGHQLGENILRANDDPLIPKVVMQDINTFYCQLEVGYNFNIKTRLQMFSQFAFRKLTNVQVSNGFQQDFFFNFGVRCNLDNFYLDL